MKIIDYLQSWSLAILLSITLVLIFFTKLTIFSPLDINPANKNIFETAVVESNCNLHKKACTAILSGGRSITLSILPRDIPLLKPLNVEVYIDNVQAISVNLEIKGIDLYMGKFRTILKDTGDFIYRGMTSLPVCSKKIMQWEAMVTIKTKNKIILAPFHFETTYTPTFIILE